MLDPRREILAHLALFEEFLVAALEKVDVRITGLGVPVDVGLPVQLAQAPYTARPINNISK